MNVWQGDRGSQDLSTPVGALEFASSGLQRREEREGEGVQMRSFIGQPWKLYTSSSLTFHCLALSRKHNTIATELGDQVHLSAFEKEEK